jgi:hypothetical protein
MKEILMEKLENCFERAIATGAKYIAVMVAMDSLPEPEIIINPAENIQGKLEYYKYAYNDNLTLKSYDRIRIVGFTFGNSIDEMKKVLYEFRK